MSEYRYLGPGGEGISELPDGVGAAMGSEYCVHLLPTAARMKKAVQEAAAKGVPLLLLTPYFRDAELKRTLPLFRAIPPGADVDVAVNDWGLLLALHGLFPRMRLSVGRLLSGQKRCPRIGSSPLLTEEGRKWHGEGVFSSSRVRMYLAKEYGVERYHLDDLPWGFDPPRPENRDPFGAPWYLHSGWAIVTVSDACSWIGGRSSAEIGSCPRKCRDGAVTLREPSMSAELLLRGKARFVAVGDLQGNAVARGPGWSRIIYGDAP